MTKLMKSKEDDFKDVFNSLQKIIATFTMSSDSTGNVNTNGFQLPTLDISKHITNERKEMFSKYGLDNLNKEEKETLLDAIVKNDEKTIDRFKLKVDAKKLSQFREQYKATEGLNNKNISNVVENLGNSMDVMMKAIDNGDDFDVNNILKNTGLNLGDFSLNDLQSQIESLNIK